MHSISSVSSVSSVVQCIAVALTAHAAAAQQPNAHPPGWNPTDSIRQLATYRPAHDTTTLLAPARIARYAPGQRAEWAAYVARSRAVHDRDTASMHAELRAVGRDTMSRAPYTHDFDVKPWMTPRWFATDSARRMADVILTFQAPNGGWSKHVDFTQGPRQRAQSYFAETNTWGWISTFDNSSTTEEIRFLALADRARPDARYRAAVLRGLDYVLAAQLPSGCWPQSYPLEGSYHDAATFNDDVMVNALSLLDSTAAGAYPFVPGALRDRARAASARGLECVLRAQVIVEGKATVWGQQHDPLTLAPTSARSYELTSLTGSESVGVVEYLMRLPSPDARVVAAVHAAADWYRGVVIRDHVYDATQTYRAQPGAGPLWARLYEIGTNRPIFSNRDGVLLYDWDRLTDRRRGYGWFTTAPAEMLKRYERWARSHPRTE
jgi:PelA/Pel-15E family pectate lyase